MTLSTMPISAAGNPAQNPGTVGDPLAAQQLPIDYFGLFGVANEDKDLLVETISVLREGWMQDRMERIRVWMLSIMMEKGIQWVGWDQSSNCWFDALAELRNNGGLEDGESVDLEKWMNNITLMFKQVFVGNLTRAVPHSVFRPANAEKPTDVQTAKAAEDLIAIIDRKNKVRQQLRSIFETLYSFGCYWCYTRPTLDGVANGFDEETVFENLEIQMPSRMKCMQCGTETPIEQLPAQVGPSAARMPQCPGCGTPMGRESFYGAGEGNRVSLKAAGTRKVPRAGVKQSIHTPLEVDVNPNVGQWWQSEVLSFDREIGFGEALELFPQFRQIIAAGATVETTANADWEKLMRTQLHSVTSGYASDMGLSRPTYSENWLNPSSYNQLQQWDFADRMKEKFPQGVKVSMIGPTVVDIRPATMRNEWSSCRLYESYGPYCPSIAERVVPFNQRFNAAMQMLDDWMQRASTGLNVMDGSRLDKTKVEKRSLVPGNVFDIPMRINGESRPMSETFMHWDLPLNPAAWNYPQMLLTFCELIAGLPPQAFGAGTQSGVDTFGGQNQMLGQAMASLQPYWENVKDERSQAAYNAILCAKQLMDCGAMKQIWMTEEAKGAGWRNKMVDWSQLQGEVEVSSDEDQGLPVTPDEMRQAFTMLFQELSKGNPAAAEWMKVPANADMVLSTMLPGSVSPVAAQITKTQMDIQILLSKPSQAIVNPDGSISQQLPVEPDKNFEDFATAKECVRNYAIEECDLRFTDPQAWERLNAYYDALEDGDAQVAAERAQRQMKVTAAGQPPPPGPDPSQQAILEEVQQLGTQMLARLGQLASLDPALTKGTASAQVSAANDVAKNAIDLAKLVSNK
jgi:hypothetical protein